MFFSFLFLSLSPHGCCWPSPSWGDASGRSTCCNTGGRSSSPGDHQLDDGDDWHKLYMISYKYHESIHSKSEKVCGTTFSVRNFAEKVRVIFGPLWVILGYSWATLGLFGPFWAMLGLFGSYLGPLWAILGHFWPLLGQKSSNFLRLRWSHRTRF